MKGIIYKYTNTINNKSYIGQTIDEVHRRQNWFKKNGNYGGIKINRARKKYGLDAFTYEVLEEYDINDFTELKSLLNQREMYYVEKYDTFKHGYNSTIGGDGNKSPMSEEQKQSLRDKWKEKIQNGYKGKYYQHTIESEERRRQTIKKKIENGWVSPLFGRTRSDEFKKNVSEGVKKAMNNDEVKEKCRLGGLFAGKLLWINNGYETKRIPKESLDEMLEQGWFHGRGKIKW